MINYQAARITQQLNRTFLSYICLFILAACSRKADILPPSDITAPLPLTKQGNDLLPLAVGNQWTYVDTTEISSGISVKTIIVTIDSARFDGNRTWYRMKNRINFSVASDEFSVSNDSVFSLQQGECMTPCYVRSLEYIRPPDTGTINYRSVYGGDAGLPKAVTLIRQRIYVPAGYADSCAMYTYHVVDEQYKEYVYPGVGLISFYAQADSSLFGPAFDVRVHLVSYQLVH
jgi:hypothetical protein